MEILDVGMQLWRPICMMPTTVASSKIVHFGSCGQLPCVSLLFPFRFILLHKQNTKREVMHGLKPYATCALKRPHGGAVAPPQRRHWQPEKVGLAWWHSQISQVTHYVIFWAGDQCVIMSCRNSASPACRNSCAHWQLAPPLNIKMFCCSGTPTDAFLGKKAQTRHRRVRAGI